MSRWGSLHTHSNHSALDGTTKVQNLVTKAKKLGYPFLGLSDHGNMAGATKLYKGCKAEGILPYVGVEAYLIDPRLQVDMDSKEAAKAGRYHVGLYARTTKGYQGLVKLVSLSHTRPRFNRFPRLTLDDLIEYAAEYSDDTILTTGCYFGLVQQTLVHTDEDDPEAAAQAAIETYAQHFRHTIVEIQNHGIEQDGMCDADIAATLVDIADELGLPILATQDSHYLHQNQKSAHALMKRMVYGGQEDEFPGDSFHLASEEWMEDHYDEDIWQQVLVTCDWLVENHQLEIPALDNYTIKMPSNFGVAHPLEQLRVICEGAISKSSDGRYHDRLEYELDIIDQLDMANYFLHVHDYVEWCRAEGICIEARGSANGSLVCYLLRITQVDPIKWGLIFDRFLSVDRKKPPDIDMDIEDKQRLSLLEYLDTQYGTARIGTWALLGANEAGTGSVLRTYQTYRARAAESEEERRKAYAVYQNLTDVERDFPEDHEGLQQLSDMNSVYKSYGVHAAGVLLSSDDFEVGDWIPSMLVASSDTKVTQFDMDDVEEWGLLKDDILGQKTLTVMRRCQELIGRSDPTDFTWIDDDDRAACALLREGRLDTGIFHFEGYTKSRGGKELGIKYTKDAVMAQALYMPGAMDSGQKDLYIERKRDKAKRDAVTYLHKSYEKALRSTYGTVIFQEQVINIMRGLGMDMEAINIFFKVVKDSGRGATARNQERLAQVRENFEKHCAENGIVEVDEAWDMTAGFIAYGFNKAHATGYGLRSYRCAYLKAHHPLEFMAALLESWAGTDKEELYIKEVRHLAAEARKRGEKPIRLLRPHVNHSEVSWTLDGSQHGLRKGLLSIKGVGEKAAEEISAKAPYLSVADLCTKVSGRGITGGKNYLATGEYTGRLLALRDAGALDDLQEHHQEALF